MAAIGILVRLLLTAAGMPIVHWYYLAAGLSVTGLVAALPSLVTLSRSRGLLVALTCCTLMMMGLGSPWNSRDRFLRVFDRVQVGTTEREVEVLLRDYLRGTGIPNLRSVTTIAVDGDLHPKAPSASQLSPQGCQVYRHSTSSFWNGDWGTVCYRAGRVVSTAFSPD